VSLVPQFPSARTAVKDFKLFSLCVLRLLQFNQSGTKRNDFVPKWNAPAIGSNVVGIFVENSPSLPVSNLKVPLRPDGKLTPT
jgi:hypothetical protein